MPRIHNFQRIAFKNQAAIAIRAQTAKKLIKAPNLSPEISRQEGSVKISTLVSIPLATIGALLGTGIQFHIIKENVIQAQNFSNLDFWGFISRPEASMDYLSVTAAGLLGALAGVGFAKIPELLNRNGDN